MMKFFESIVNFSMEVISRIFKKESNLFKRQDKPAEKYRIQHILNGDSTKEYYAHSEFTLKESFVPNGNVK